VRAFVGVTDGDWYELLAAQAHLDEVNFWQPGGHFTTACALSRASRKCSTARASTNQAR
jgi:hypothetical protein